MFLKNLNLIHFRNYPKLDFKFTTPITVLVGDNAQGKSNFLEAIYFLATSKSPKAEKEDELILKGQNHLRVSSVIDQTGGKLSLEVVIVSNETSLTKKAKVNGISRRMVDYSENLSVVLFAPEDVNLVSGSPSLRRNYLDQVLSQTHRAYKRSLISYENVLVRKNKLLKRIRDGFAKVEELAFWYDQQILLGTLITEKRSQFFQIINSVEKKFGEYSFVYLANLVTLDRLKEYQSKEIAAASSLVGPHRDDFRFELNSRDLSKFGSRGEQRTGVLDLKISEVSYIEECLKDRPVLLLDDIFSELDQSHRGHVIELSRIQQTIIATVEWDEYLKSALKDAKIYTVKNGKIR